MKKVLAAVVGIISVAIAFIVFPIITDATTSLLTDENTQTVASATAVGNSYTATVNYDVYEGKTTSVLSVTSSDTSSNPVVSAVSGKQITITGLENGAQNLVIKYQSAALGDYTGLSAIIKIAPMLVLIVIVISLITGLFRASRE